MQEILWLSLGCWVLIKLHVSLQLFVLKELSTKQVSVLLLASTSLVVEILDEEEMVENNHAVHLVGKWILLLFVPSLLGGVRDDFTWQRINRLNIYRCNCEKSDKKRNNL